MYRLLTLLMFWPALAMAVDADQDGFDDTVDCNDTDPSIFPGASEIPADFVDQDCDGQEACYEDQDNDAYGSSALVTSPNLSCQGPGLAGTAGDCDDTRPTVFPGSAEVPADGIDQDCDGLEACYEDQDNDAYGTQAFVQSTNLTCQAPGLATNAGDCDDTRPTVFPGAVEVIADGIDQDCDGLEDCYEDLDGDAYGVATTVSSPSLSCSGPGASDNDDDCDDTRATVFPGAVEIPGDGVDQDCDGFDAGLPLGGMAIARSCPGTGRAVVTWTDATPSGPVAVLIGPAGSTSVPSGPCAGTPVGVQAGPSTVFLDASNGRGNGFLYFPSLPRQACGMATQVLDIGTCSLTPVMPWL